MTRITAKPGTPEYEQQFEQQERESIDNATSLVLVRVTSGVFALVFAAGMVGAICKAALEGSWWTFANSLLLGAVIVLPLLFVALFGKTLRSRIYWSKKQQRDDTNTSEVDQHGKL